MHYAYPTRSPIRIGCAREITAAKHKHEHTRTHTHRRQATAIHFISIHPNPLRPHPLPHPRLAIWPLVPLAADIKQLQYKSSHQDSIDVLLPVPLLRLLRLLSLCWKTPPGSDVRTCACTIVRTHTHARADNSALDPTV